MRRTARRDPANDREVARQGNIVFWMTLVGGLVIVVLVVLLILR